MRVSLNEKNFLIDGKEIRIISGAIHYFRVVPEYWEDRLKKLKACGFNTVETYMPWNLHEPHEGTFCFEGLLDIERFIDIADKLGLYVIIRPGPYICAEWEFGGFPAWLLAKEGIKLRCQDELYLGCVRRYFHEVFKHIRGHLIENGGPVIMMQVENEYGSYGMDHDYMRSVANIFHDENMPVFLFTSDGDDLSMLNGGGLPDIFKVVNFGSDCHRNFQHLREFQPDGPLMCGEFWNGWFDHWGEEHHVRAADDTARELDEILKIGGSVNFYMFHGGTNFNFWNGANHAEVYQPTVTSYDYHCLLNENGDRTEKYYACQEVLRKHGFAIEALEVHDQPKAAYGELQLEAYAPLFKQLDHFASRVVTKPYVLPMEKLGQNFGFVLYRAQLTGPFQPRPLKIMGLHDRACIYLDGKYLGVYERDQAYEEILIGVPAGKTAVLDILTENMGRVNYGPELYDYKGITKAVLLGIQEIHGWQMYCLEMDDFSQVHFEAVQSGSLPALYRGKLQIEEPQDTFIYLDDFRKGNVFINGFNIGRYFERGPQRSLYVPGPLLKKGENIIEIFDVHGTERAVVTFKDKADLG